ncbi:MAG: hypothetical protein ACR2QM_17825 [Longimicrobiales bacterium]
MLLLLVILIAVVALAAKAGASLAGKGSDTSLRPGEVERILRDE